MEKISMTQESHKEDRRKIIIDIPRSLLPVILVEDIKKLVAQVEPQAEVVGICDNPTRSYISVKVFSPNYQPTPIGEPYPTIKLSRTERK